MKYYKVVRQTPDEVGLISCFLFHDGPLRYSLGSWTNAVPGSVGIFIFKKVDDADNFIYWQIFNRGLRIFEVEVRGPIIPLNVRVQSRGKTGVALGTFSTHLSRQERIQRLKKTVASPKLVPNPKGTFSAQAVKLSKEVF